MMLHDPEIWENPGNFISKLFTKVGEKQASAALKSLANKDPEFKKDYENLLALRNKMNKRLNTKAKRDAALKRAIKQYG